MSHEVIVTVDLPDLDKAEADIAALQAQVSALDARVTALEQNGGTAPPDPQPDDGRDPTDLDHWKLVFDDDFTGPGLDTARWHTTYYGGVRQLSANGEHQLYVEKGFVGQNGKVVTYDPFAFGNSTMSISAIPTPADQLEAVWNVPYLSGMVRSEAKWSVAQHGPLRFICRAWLNLQKGVWPAFWGVAENMWPPEWDALEAFGKLPDGQGGADQFHWGGFGGPGQNDNNWGDWAKAHTDLTAGFHNYAIDMDGTEVRYYFDEHKVGGWAFPEFWRDKLLNLQFNCAVGGNWCGYPDASNKWPATQQVDFIRAYTGK